MMVVGVVTSLKVADLMCQKGKYEIIRFHNTYSN